MTSESQATTSTTTTVSKLVHSDGHPSITRSQHRADYFTLTDSKGMKLGAGPFHFVCRLAR